MVPTLRCQQPRYNHFRVQVLLCPERRLKRLLRLVCLLSLAIQRLLGFLNSLVRSEKHRSRLAIS